MNLIAFIAFIVGLLLGWRWGKQAMVGDASEVMRLVQEGAAVVNEDGTVSLIETFVDAQRIVAEMQ